MGQTQHAISALIQRRWQQSYPGTTDQVRHVRAALRQYLTDCPVADDAVLLLSELSANAIAHSHSGKPGGTFIVRAQHVAGSHVHGEVEDQGSDWHGELPLSATPPHGLYLLQFMASACGVKQTGRGHLAWFRLEYPRNPIPADEHPAANPPAPHRQTLPSLQTRPEATP